jgi:hypothetical protein
MFTFWICPWISASNISGINSLSVSENSVLRKTLFGPKMDEVTGGSRILDKDKLSRFVILHFEWGLENLTKHSSVPGQEVLLFSQESTPNLVTNNPPIQCALASLSHEVQQLRRKTDHSSHLVPRLKASRAMPPLSSMFLDVHRDNFTSYLLFLICWLGCHCFLFYIQELAWLWLFSKWGSIWKDRVVPSNGHKFRLMT